MKRIRRRIVALVCCMAMLVTGLYVVEPTQVQAADTEISITTPKTNFDMANKYINVDISKLSDWGNIWYTFVNETNRSFVQQYITFDGGMTYDDFVEGLAFIRIATEGIIQFNWSTRTKLFQAGWSFTIEQGAPMSYKDTAQAEKTVYLDKEYTFTFSDDTANNRNYVDVDGVKTTTFSLQTGTYWGNGTSDSNGAGILNFNSTDNSVTDYQQTYTYFQNDSKYEEYFQLGDLSYNELQNNVKIRYILDRGARCIQIEQWGTLRTTLKTGDQLIFYKGFPIYYTDTNGVKWRATLDATYVYECLGSNADNSQTFQSVRVDDSTEKFGFKTVSGSTTWIENGAITTNLTMQACANESVDVNTDILTDKIAEEYIEISGYTVSAAKNMGVSLRYIANANDKCIQLKLSGDAKNLPAGTTITLKKGMPIAYGNSAAFYAGALDNNYRIIIDETDGSAMKISCYLYDTYNLKTGNLTSTTEGNGKYHYWAIKTQDVAFTDVKKEGEFTLSKDVMSEYLYLSGHDVANMYNDASEQAVYLKAYTFAQSVFQGIRFYDKEVTYTDQEIMILRKGLPISYTTSDDRTKVVTLDKDYGYYYDASAAKFVYDASLVYEEVIKKDPVLTINDMENKSFAESNTEKHNLIFTATPTLTLTKDQWVNMLSNEETASYIEICGYTAADLTAMNVGLLFIPQANTIQLSWGNLLTSVSVGDTVSFKKDMPINYNDGSAKVLLNEDICYTVSSVEKTDTRTQVTIARYAEPGTWALQPVTFGTGNANNDYRGLNILNPATGNADLLSEITSKLYYTFPDAVVTDYIDFCEWTLDEIKKENVTFRVVKDGGSQIFQVGWGTSAAKLAIGSLITFREGMPFEYTTADGYKKLMYLDRDYVYQVAAGNEGNTRVLNYMTSTVGGTWGLNSGEPYNVAKGDGEGYYNNITMSDTEFTTDVSSIYLSLDYTTLGKYLKFGNIAPSEYESLGIKAIVIISGNDKVVQLRWGYATDRIKEGDKIVFKKGLSVVGTRADNTKAIYTLDANYSFTIKEHTDGKNGYRITGVKDTTEVLIGDLGSDYLLNKNDVDLLRMYLAGSVTLSNGDVANITKDDKPCGSRDLVRAKKQWGSVAEPEHYETLYKSNGASMTIPAGESVTLNLNKDIGTKNYVRLTYCSNQNLLGYFKYSSDGTSNSGEEFYLQADENQFRQFFDNYRTNGVNIASKKLESIKLTNVGSADANVCINKVEISDRVLDDTQMQMLDNGSVKIGVDLNMGGALAYLESLSYAPTEVQDKNTKEIRIEHDYKASSNTTALSSNVNLVNIYDLGRQIQQSYYIDVKDSDYTHGSYDGNSNWPYNPVQAGDKNYNESQIIDYRLVDTDTHTLIYVKTRAMDWSQNNRTTKSYMENWYMLNQNMVEVDNAFVNWEGFTNAGNSVNQELPALYTAQSFNYFVEGKDTTNRKTYGDWTTDAKFMTEDTSDWYAWVNDETATDAFGLGIYIPGVRACTAGRCVTTNKYSTGWDTWNAANTRNQNAKESPMYKTIGAKYSYLKDFCTSDYTNSFVFNTSYIAPTYNTVLDEYKTYEYTYVLSVDTLDKMATSFNGLKDTITNDQFKADWSKN